MQKLRSSFAYAAADSYISVAMQLISTVVLSRILTPAEIGVYAVAAVFAALASNFRDFGIAEYLIQAPSLTAERIRAAFTVNIGASWLVAALIFGGAGLAGDFYRSEAITAVMHVQALNFLLIPFGAINMAGFRRDLNFKPIFMAGVASNIVTLTVSVACAWRGMGPMSLAWSSLAGVAVTVLISLLYRPADYPRWPGLKGLPEVLHFGGFASGIYFVGQLGKGAPEMIIGKAQDLTAAAVFSRANGLVQIFHQLVMRALMPVCLPYFARSVREEQSVVRGYLVGVAYVTVIGWPFLGFLALNAFPAIRLVYGDQWLASVPLARVLCLAAAIELVHHLAKEAMVSSGHVKLGSRLQLFLQAAQILGLLLVIPFGLAGAAWGVLAASTLGLGLSQWHMHAAARLSIAALWQSCRISLWVTLIALAPATTLAFTVQVGESNFARHLIVATLFTAPAWLLGLRLTHHPLWTELSYLAGQALAAIGRRVRPSPPAA